MFNFMTKQVDTVWTLGAIKCRPCFFPMHKKDAVISGRKMNLLIL